MYLSLRARGCALTLLTLAFAALPDTTWAQGKMLTPVERGQKLFKRVWEPRDSEAAGDGLGPLFNERSCVACHMSGGMGGAGPTAKNVVLLTVPAPEPGADLAAFNTRLLKVHPGFGSDTTIVLHHFSSDPLAYTPFRQKLLGLDPPILGDQVRKTIAVRSILRKEGTGTLKAIKVEGIRLLLAERNTTPLFGLGLIDSISPAEIEEVARAESSEQPAVSGRFVGRFGWRGQMLQLDDFVRGACAVELGLQVSTQEQAIDPTVPAKDRKAAKPDLTDRQCDDLTAFVARLPAPRRLPPADHQAAAMINNGEHLFDSVGCAVCHRPTLGQVSGIYSDLLVHDMGANLADPSPAPTAPARPTSGGARYYGSGPSFEPHTEELLVRMREWKTPPLWGLHDSGPYLHDGRATTVTEAIAYHGGEAASSVDRYLALPGDARARLLAFLDTLAAPEASTLSPWSAPSGKSPKRARPPRAVATHPIHDAVAGVAGADL